MPDIFDLIARWWKQMFAVLFLSLLAVGIITFSKPRKYLSVATAVPASSFASDRSKIFNENIQALYSTLGTPDDLDMIVGTANLDTVYMEAAQQFNLYDHYKIKEKEDAAVSKAASLLKANTKVMKSEYGELKVKVWDTDKNLAPQLANAIMNLLDVIHRDLQSAGNKNTREALTRAKEKIQMQVDTLPPSLHGELQERILGYEKMIGEYQLMIDMKPPVLFVKEKARVSSWPDKPKRMQIMIATAVLSFLFALLAALVMERRKNKA
ncbi:MAG: hypothetical protein HOP10_06885 [Chitinophagaceae bacterium]|nr:hypothetical protein [Chitinophagaceae bacterium]